jgi:signal transduction histidine kinase
LRTGRPARFEHYTGIPGTIADACRRIGFQAGVGAPIVVDGELWGLVGAGADPGRSLPADAERRLSQFTALAATAISNSQAREDLRGLADVQAALRRVAMLVAEGATPADVFAAVAREVARVLKLPMAGMYRYEPDDTVTVVGARGGHAFQPGTNWPLDGPSLASLVRRTGRPGTIDDYTEVPGTIGEAAARSGIMAGVGAPIVVDGELWGIVGAGAEQGELVPPDAERRLSEFTALVAAAISNMQAREELLASRVRIVEAADEQRRRVVRDLHDGAQERMIHAIFALQRAHDRDDAPPDVRSLVEEGVTHVRSAIRELRELAHGIHPEILTQQGLAAAVQPLADRAPLPVDIDIPEERYPTPVESAAYFVAAEALTNVAKYARASTARITGTRTPAGLSLVVEDDGIGGAKRMAGRGLAGLGDRLAALHGALTVDSPPRGGTRIRAEIPLDAGAGPTRASGLPE